MLNHWPLLTRRGQLTISRLMNQILQKIPFRQEYQPGLQGFFCDNELWQQDIADWIKGDRVVNDIRDRGCEVWLYTTGQSDVIGYGSLGVSEWRVPEKGPKIRVNIIPYLGIDQRYWGQPPGPREQRFSTQVLEHLTIEASRHHDRRPFLGLFVHRDNTGAIKLYERLHFDHFRDSGEYIVMLRSL